MSGALDPEFPGVVLYPGMEERVDDDIIDPGKEELDSLNKRIRKAPKGKPDKQLHEVRKERLQLLEEQSQKDHIDFYYADDNEYHKKAMSPMVGSCLMKK